MKPVIGSRVLYKLIAYDAEQINHDRADANAFRHGIATVAQVLGGPPRSGDQGRTGHVAHLGNQAAEGDVYPADVVRIFSPGSTTVNLQVHLDGNDHYWATSRQEGDGPGQWSWPGTVIEGFPADLDPASES